MGRQKRRRCAGEEANRDICDELRTGVRNQPGRVDNDDDGSIAIRISSKFMKPTPAKTTFGAIILVAAGILFLMRSNIIPSGQPDSGSGNSPGRTQSRQAEIDRKNGKRRMRSESDPRPKNPLADYIENLSFDHPPPEDAERWLSARGRTTNHLIAAWEVTRSLEFLRSAALGDPPDRLALLLLASHEDTPEAKRKAAEAFAALDPDNSLGDYFLAWHAFENDQTEEGLRRLRAASNKPVYHTYRGSLRDEIRDLHEFLGLDPLVAKAMASDGIGSPSGSQQLGITKQLRSLYQEAANSGDHESASGLLQDGLLLARRGRESESLLDALVFTTCEITLLKCCPPDAVPVPGGPTAGEMMASQNSLREELMGLASSTLEQLGRIPPAAAHRYYEIARTEGELAAARWLRDTGAGDHPSEIQVPAR